MSIFLEIPIDASRKNVYSMKHQIMVEGVLIGGGEALRRNIPDTFGGKGSLEKSKWHKVIVDPCRELP
jgi:hypothetical protein